MGTLLPITYNLKFLYILCMINRNMYQIVRRKTRGVYTKTGSMLTEILVKHCLKNKRENETRWKWVDFTRHLRPFLPDRVTCLPSVSSETSELSNTLRSCYFVSDTGIETTPFETRLREWKVSQSFIKQEVGVWNGVSFTNNREKHFKDKVYFLFL